MKENEMLYQMAISLYKKLLNKGLISKKEYKKIDDILIKKYEPYISELLY